MIRLQLIFVGELVFGVVLFWMFMALCSSLILLMLEKEIRGLLRSVMVGGVWNGFLLGRVRGQPTPCKFCSAPDGDGHLFWECTFPPLVEIRESAEFHDLKREDKVHWPRCLLWHGWLPLLSGVNRASPWAVDASESACYMVVVGLWRYSSTLLAEWGPSDGYDVVEVASSMPDHPNVWTDGSLVLDRVTGISASGAGFFAHSSEECWSGSRWSHVDRVHIEGQVLSCRGCCFVPGALQSVQRAEMWGVILALQSSSAVHLGWSTTWVWFVMLGVFLMVVLVPLLLNMSMMVTCSCSWIRCFIFVVVKRFGFLMLRGMLMRVLLIVVVGGLVMRS